MSLFNNIGSKTLARVLYFSLNRRNHSFLKALMFELQINITNAPRRTHTGHWIVAPPFRTFILSFEISVRSFATPNPT